MWRWPRSCPRLGITAPKLVTLRLFPLVLVAWAEETADPQERHAVMECARQLGVREDTTAWLVLDAWLRRRPPGLGVDAWKRYVRGLLGKLSQANAERLIELTEKQMTQIANASGGHLGFGKVSRKERTMIRRLVATMHQLAQLAQQPPMPRNRSAGAGEPPRS